MKQRRGGRRTGGCAALLALLAAAAQAAPPGTAAAAAPGESLEAAIALGLVPRPAPTALQPAAPRPAVPQSTGPQPAAAQPPRGGLALRVEPRRLPAGPPPGLRLVTITTDEARRSGTGPSPELLSLIDEVARTYGHDAQLLHAIIRVESGFNPNAVSPKGAIGLMQVMPATAERVGVQEPQRALFDPETNLHAGARYLRLLMDMFSDRPDLAVAAYNAGEGAVLRYRGEVPPFRETQAYVRDVMALYLAPKPAR
jgi:soluble lytic murein transglycosylase-like protein